MKKTCISLITLLCLLQQLFAEPEPSTEPLFSGTLLAYFPTNTPVGTVYIEPYVFATRTYGSYKPHWSLERQKSSHQIQSLNVISAGLIPQYLDVSLVLNAFYGQIGNRHSILYGDTQIYFGSQLLINKKGSWVPDFRLILLQSFPTGKYQNLNPQKQGTDISGSGSYQTSFILVMRKIFYDLLSRPCNLSLNLYYILSTKTPTNGLSIYGGAPKIKGIATPGDQFIANLAFEYSLTRNWGWGIDTRYEHQNTTPFKTNKTPPSSNSPSWDRYSLAPCLEYNFSDLLSIESGVWFSVAGRNANAFVSSVTTIYYAF